MDARVKPAESVDIAHEIHTATLGEPGDRLTLSPRLHMPGINVNNMKFVSSPMACRSGDLIMWQVQGALDHVGHAFTALHECLACQQHNRRSREASLHVAATTMRA